MFLLGHLLGGEGQRVELGHAQQCSRSIARIMLRDHSVVLRVTLSNTRERTRVDCMQGKHLSPWTLSGPEGFEHFPKELSDDSIT